MGYSSGESIQEVPVGSGDDFSSKLDIAGLSLENPSWMKSELFENWLPS